MDLPSLAVILQAALSPNPDERKAAEQSLNQVPRSLFIFDSLVTALRVFKLFLGQSESELCYSFARFISIVCNLLFSRELLFLKN